MVRRGPNLDCHQPRPLSSTNGIVIQPRLRITIDLRDRPAGAEEAGDLIKGSVLTHLRHDSIKASKFVDV